MGHDGVSQFARVGPGLPTLITNHGKAYRARGRPVKQWF